MSFNIAIDGPAGAGKSTIAKQLATKLDFIYVDTGAMYRALAYFFLQKGVDIASEDAICSVVNEAHVEIAYEDGKQQVLLNEENVTAFLREEAVGEAASVTSAYGCVREHLLQLQRELASKKDVIMDGRDIGTCVLPNAPLKIYLTASTYTRAQRRYDELVAKGEHADFELIEAGIIERDERDMNREIAPLKQAEDAIYLDSSNMGIAEVVTTIFNLAKERM
ncbi:MAG: (d)CMP kinase [Lachnospiraceae bacterium]|jgi:cytidylate kinase|nr:(d)CMP kinase [Lachnospiraceae bacterium]